MKSKLRPMVAMMACLWIAVSAARSTVTATIAGPPSTATVSPAGAADERELRALHEKVMRAHRESNVEILLEDEAADYVVAGRGEITRPTLDDRRARLGAYLGSTRFESYVDVVPPVVAVSTDGTLGWVVVQVEGRGVQTADDGTRGPLQFVSAWIELYQKRDGKWLRVGNVSNFKP